MQDNNRKHHLRVERDETITVHEDENSHLWAVSYSDFLMALLSFFILFFSTDNVERKSLILNLADQFQTSVPGATVAGKTGSAENRNTAANGNSSGAPGSDLGSIPGGSATAAAKLLADSQAEEVSEGKQAGGIGRVPANLIRSIANLKVTVDKEKEHLVVHFADNFFRPGKHDIGKANAKTITQFLSILQPYSDRINLYFEGNADAKPVHKEKNSIVVDNYVLSSLRASSAVLLAKKMGFSEKNLYIQGNSSNTRNSRTLSIRVESKEEGL